MRFQYSGAKRPSAAPATQSNHAPQPVHPAHAPLTPPPNLKFLLAQKEMKKRRYTACGGVVVRQDRVLVLLRPSRHEVRLPKGHVESGETCREAAAREVEEESGYAATAFLADLGEQVVEFDHEGCHYVRTERYFLMATGDPDAASPSPAEPQFEPAWLTWEEALDQLTYEAEREWVRRARRAGGRRPPREES